MRRNRDHWRGDPFRRYPSRSTEELARLKKDELVELAKAEGVDESGTKAEIAERLADEVPHG